MNDDVDIEDLFDPDQSLKFNVYVKADKDQIKHVIDAVNETFACDGLPSMVEHVPHVPDVPILEGVPLIGSTITVEQLEEVVDEIKTRSQNFPNEPGAVTFSFILQNFGRRYTPVECETCGWKNVIMNVQRTGGNPTCPDGHELSRGKMVSLGWVVVE